MHYSPISYLSWVALALAITLWAGVGSFVWVIWQEESARASRAADAEQGLIQQSAQLRLHALARETKDARTKLEEIARRDVAEILDSIEGVARDSRIPVKIGEALSQATSDSASSVRAAALIVEAEGTFTQVTYAAALLESLPIPSRVDELQFERLLGNTGAGKSRANLWRVVARMHFLTTADISL